MRKVFRHEGNDDYWNRRWSESAADRDFSDLTIYPIRYAEMVVGPPGQKILEIGCGLGRVLKHYHIRGYAVAGIERSQVAVARIQETSPELDVKQASADALPFADASFDVVLAFGVYHNIEEGMEKSIDEAARVLRPGGHFCISMRPDNLEMRLNEHVWRMRNPSSVGEPRFHKWLTAPSPFADLLKRYGLEVEQIHFARNMSILYRLPFLRERSARQATETDRRSSGYRLNYAGRSLDRLLRKVAPYQMCNVIVFSGRRGDPS
jgi:SAM-dependent methyltransferase